MCPCSYPLTQIHIYITTYILEYTYQRLCRPLCVWKNAALSICVFEPRATCISTKRRVASRIGVKHKGENFGIYPKKEKKITRIVVFFIQFSVNFFTFMYSEVYIFGDIYRRLLYITQREFSLQ